MAGATAVRASVAAGLAGLALLVAAGVWLISVYISGERERDLRQWEARLGLVADGKADAIGRLLQAERRTLEELAENASLQLYLWQLLQDATSANLAADSARQGYLRNLLLAVADRAGYLPEPAARIPANVARTAAGGLILLDRALGPVVATPGFGSPAPVYGDFLATWQAAPAQARAALLLDGDERPVLAIAVPVGPPPGVGPDAVGPTGVILGIRSAEQELLPLLRRVPAFAEDSEALLLVREGPSVLFLSPTRDGSGALRRSLPLDRPGLAEAAAVLEPGGFLSARNYQDRPVLQVSRRIRGQDWVLAQQVDGVAALAAANERRSFLLAVLSLVLLFTVASVLAAWRHGSSVRARHQAEELAARAARLERQTHLLHTISDSIDVLTLLVSRDGEVRFTNQATAAAVRVRRADLVGRTLAGVLGPAGGALAQASILRARRDGVTVHELLQLDLPGGSRSFQGGFVPIPRLGERQDLTLIVLSDVTELKQAEARHGELLRRLVTTLAQVVDRRDPWAADHAGRTSQVADAVARELALDDHEREHLDLAATLANIGKSMIPAELLTKPGPLTLAERQLLQRHVDYTLALLEGVEFDGPVLEIIAQKQEHLDGSGYPRGLTESQLSMAGRILAVANAFVALVSARAYRQGVPVRAALDELLDGAGTRYDRRVIAALFHVAENRLDWSRWADGAGGPEPPASPG